MVKASFMKTTPHTTSTSSGTRKPLLSVSPPPSSSTVHQRNKSKEFIDCNGQQEWKPDVVSSPHRSTIVQGSSPIPTVMDPVYRYQNSSDLDMPTNESVNHLKSGISKQEPADVPLSSQNATRYPRAWTCANLVDEQHTGLTNFRPYNSVGSLPSVVQQPEGNGSRKGIKVFVMLPLDTVRGGSWWN
jgi:hypothetical protein